jgi:hypothetical protein
MSQHKHSLSRISCKCNIFTNATSSILETRKPAIALHVCFRCACLLDIQAHVHGHVFLHVGFFTWKICPDVCLGARQDLWGDGRVVAWLKYTQTVINTYIHGSDVHWRPSRMPFVALKHKNMRECGAGSYHKGSGLNHTDLHIDTHVRWVKVTPHYLSYGVSEQRRSNLILFEDIVGVLYDSVDLEKEPDVWFRNSQAAGVEVEREQGLALELDPNVSLLATCVLCGIFLNLHTISLRRLSFCHKQLTLADDLCTGICGVYIKARLPQRQVINTRSFSHAASRQKTLGHACTCV